MLKILDYNKIDLDLEKFLIALSNADFNEKIKIFHVKSILLKKLKIDCKCPVLEKIEVKKVLSKIFGIHNSYGPAYYLIVKEHVLEELLSLTFYLENKFKKIDVNSLKFNPEKLFFEKINDNTSLNSVLLSFNDEIPLFYPFFEINESHLEKIETDNLKKLLNSDFFLTLKLTDHEKYNSVIEMIEKEILKRALA